MKKILVVVVALASMNAFATRARVNALGNSPHLVDTQTVYGNPADMMIMGDFVTMESGTTAGGAQNANAEGMVTRSMGDSKMALSLGHQSVNASIWGLRAAGVNVTGFTTTKSQQNPVELSYGMKSADMSWGATLAYSNYNDKVAVEKESSAGIRGGMRMGALDAKFGLGLVNTYENATDGKFTGTMGISAGAGYSMDNLYFSGSIANAAFKTENPAAVEQRKFDKTEIKISALSSHKKDGNEFFYGAGLTSATTKVTLLSTTDIKKTDMVMPIWMGLEVDAASWLTLRGSITQNTLINSTKTDTAGTTTAELAPDVNSTTASVGAGMKFNKLTLDGSLTGLTGSAASQNINGTDLLGQVGVTYMF
jgi:hypothetical protein